MCVYMCVCVSPPHVNYKLLRGVGAVFFVSFTIVVQLLSKCILIIEGSFQTPVYFLESSLQ